MARRGHLFITLLAVGLSSPGFAATEIPNRHDIQPIVEQCAAVEDCLPAITAFLARVRALPAVDRDRLVALLVEKLLPLARSGTRDDIFLAVDRASRVVVSWELARQIRDAGTAIRLMGTATGAIGSDPVILQRTQVLSDQTPLPVETATADPQAETTGTSPFVSGINLPTFRNGEISFADPDTRSVDSIVPLPDLAGPDGTAPDLIILLPAEEPILDMEANGLIVTLRPMLDYGAAAPGPVSVEDTLATDVPSAVPVSEGE